MKRTDAARAGKTRFNGTPCKLGHDGKRYTSTGACVVCSTAANKAYVDKIRKLLQEAKK